MILLYTSAFRDDRFGPVALEEVPKLEVEVSLLHSFEHAKNALDWEVGKHGIMIDFDVDDESYGATFLPEVAEEEGWDQLTTLKYLVHKAGYFYTPYIFYMYFNCIVNYLMKLNVLVIKLKKIILALMNMLK